MTHKKGAHPPRGSLLIFLSAQLIHPRTKGVLLLSNSRIQDHPHIERTYSHSPNIGPTGIPHLDGPKADDHVLSQPSDRPRLPTAPLQTTTAASSNRSVASAADSNSEARSATARRGTRPWRPTGFGFKTLGSYGWFQGRGVGRCGERT